MIIWRLWAEKFKKLKIKKKIDRNWAEFNDIFFETDDSFATNDLECSISLLRRHEKSKGMEITVCLTKIKFLKYSK